MAACDGWRLWATGSHRKRVACAALLALVAAALVATASYSAGLGSSQAIAAGGERRLKVGQKRKAHITFVMLRPEGWPRTWFEALVREILVQHARDESEDDNYCKFQEQNGVIFKLTCDDKAIIITSNKDMGGLVQWPSGHIDGWDMRPIPEWDDWVVNCDVKVELFKRPYYYLPYLRDPRALVTSVCHERSAPRCGLWLTSRINATSHWINFRYRFFTAMAKESSKGGSMPRARVTFYEKLKENFTAEVRELGRYILLGTTLTPSALEAIQAAMSTPKMRQSEGIVGSPVERKKAPGNHTAADSEVCGFAQEIDAEHLKVAAEIMRPILRPELNEVFKC